MPEEKTIKVLIGEKISAEDAKKLDPAKRGVITARKSLEAGGAVAEEKEYLLPVLLRSMLYLG